MEVKIDTHTHTLASGHAYNTIREMAAMAKQKGLEGLPAAFIKLSEKFDVLKSA